MRARVAMGWIEPEPEPELEEAEAEPEAAENTDPLAEAAVAQEIEQDA
jgi:hypothetical protein